MIAGIHIYKNVLNHGEWILQEKFVNADWLRNLLPANAPLSTLRIVTTSSYLLHTIEGGIHTDPVPAIAPSADRKSESQPEKFVRAVSGALRLGLRDAATDHKSVLFDVDVITGTRPSLPTATALTH